MHQNGMFVPSSLVELARRDDKIYGETSREKLIRKEDMEHTVLVTDDDAISRSLVVRAIHEMCNVYQAETGYEALHLLTMHPEIDIVCLDLRMPGQHGLETLSEMQELRPDVAVIIVSGFVRDIPEEVLNKDMIICAVKKPFTTSDIATSRDGMPKRLFFSIGRFPLLKRVTLFADGLVCNLSPKAHTTERSLCTTM